MALHFVLGGIYLCILPLWGGVPDEPLHYSHIKFVGEFGRLPLITDPRKFGGGLWGYHFTADPVGTAQHGPLYYWSAAPLFVVTKALTVEAQIYVLRCWSLLWGAAMLPFLWATLRRVFRDAPALVFGLTLCVTLLPHRLLMSAVVYNDIASATMLTIAFWALSRALEDEARVRMWMWAGIALGLACITKRVAMVAIPAFVVAVWLQGARVGLSRTQKFQHLGALVGAFLLVAGWWFARDVWLYGELFPTEPSFARRSWSDLLLYAEAEELQFMFTYALRGLWLSLWSQVGWLPWEDPNFAALSLFVYGGFALVSIAVAIGVFAGWRSRWRGVEYYARDWAVVSLLVVLGMIYGALNWVLRYSFHGNEETGKHAISIAVCVLVLLGLASRFWIRERKAALLPFALAGLLGLYNVGALWNLDTVLIPRYAPKTPALAKMRVRDLPSGRAPGIWHRYRVPRVEQIGGEVPRPANAMPPLGRSSF